MAFGQLEDLTGQAELVIFPDAYASYEAILKSDGAVIIKGTAETDSGTAKILVDEVKALGQQLKSAKKLIFHLDASHSEKLALLKEALKAYPGSTGISLSLKLPEISKRVQLDIQEPSGVDPSPLFFEKIDTYFGRTDFIEVH